MTLLPDHANTPGPMATDALDGASAAVAVDRRAWIAHGAAIAGGLVLAACGRDAGGPPPPSRVDRQRRPETGRTIDPRPHPPLTEPEIRVRIGQVRSGDPLTVTPTGRWLRVEQDGSGGSTVLEGTLRIEASGEEWRLTPARGPVLRVPRSGLNCSPVPGEPARLSVARGDGAAHEVTGRIAIVPGRGDAASDLVATMPIEAYLPGVLARELYRHWSPACFQAQAIAARSFAVCEAAHWRTRRHFDLTDGPDTQAWTGVRGAGDASSGPEAAAVAATRGTLLIWDRRVVPAYFSSACGGLPARASDAIGSSPANAIPPLEGRSDRGRCCDDAPTYRWIRQVSTPEVARGLANWASRRGRRDAVTLSRLRSIEVFELNPNGRPVTFELLDDLDRRDRWSAETFRLGLSGAMPRGVKPIYSSAIDPSIDADTARFVGRGHGHGVGLCQYGSEAMAADGRDAETILARYYPGAVWHRAWA